MKKLLAIILVFASLSVSSAQASWDFETTYECSADQLTAYNGSYITFYNGAAHTNGGISVYFYNPEFMDIYGNEVEVPDEDIESGKYHYVPDKDMYQTYTDYPRKDNEAYYSYSYYNLDYGRYEFDLLYQSVRCYCEPDGYYIYYKDGKYGITTTDYVEILPCIYEDIHYCYDDMFALTDENGTSLVNIKTGKTIVAAEAGIKKFYFFKQGLCAVGGAVIDITGRKVLSGANRYQIGENGIITVRKTGGGGKDDETGIYNPNMLPEWEILRTLYHPSFVSVNDELIPNAEGRTINDRTLFPMRAISEKLGASVDWDETTRTVTAVKGKITIVLQIGNNVMKVNGEEIVLDAAPQIMDNLTMLPVRALAEAFGAQVDWNPNTRVAEIYL